MMMHCLGSSGSGEFTMTFLLSSSPSSKLKFDARNTSSCFLRGKYPQLSASLGPPDLVLTSYLWPDALCLTIRQLLIFLISCLHRVDGSLYSRKSISLQILLILSFLKMKFSEMLFWNYIWGTYQSCVFQLCFCSLVPLPNSSAFLVSCLPGAHCTKESMALWLKSKWLQNSPEYSKCTHFISLQDLRFSQMLSYLFQGLCDFSMSACVMFPPYVSHLRYLKTVFIAQNKETHLFPT